MNNSEYFQLRCLQKALELELLGMRHSRGSAYAEIKNRFGFRGSREKVAEKFSEYIENYLEELGAEK